MDWLFSWLLLGRFIFIKGVKGGGGGCSHGPSLSRFNNYKVRSNGYLFTKVVQLLSAEGSHGIFLAV